MEERHAKLAKPSIGNYGRNEWSFTGSDCTTIRDLATEIIAALGVDYQIAYIDTYHKKDDETIELPGMLAVGARIEYSNQMEYASINSASLREQEMDSSLRNCDLILVNGNHHQATRQVVIIDSKKRESLLKRMPQLSSIKLILIRDGDVYDFIPDGAPVLSIHDTSAIIDFFRNQLIEAVPPVYGLVLAGGRSKRMGEDKSKMQWHGKEQKYFLADMLAGQCEKVFISCRADQGSEIDENYFSLPDTFYDLGPYGAILSAFRYNPDAAWLVLASDLPLLTPHTLENLIENRNPSWMATAYAQPGSGKPEPLIAIWEPKSYPILLSYLAKGYSCPKKVMEKNHVMLVDAVRAEELMNVNTPEERSAAHDLLNRQHVE